MDSPSPISTKPSRPVWVWIFSLYLFFAHSIVALKYAYVLTGSLSIPASYEGYVKSPVNIALVLAIVPLGLAGALALFLLRRIALHLLVSALLLELVSTATDLLLWRPLFPAEPLSIAALTVMELMNVGAVLYVWRLVRQGVLTGSPRGGRSIAPLDVDGRPSWSFIVRLLPVLLGSGLVWQVMDCRARGQSARLEELRAANELYAQLQQVNAEVSPLLPEYVLRRDDQIRAGGTDAPPFGPESTVIAAFRKRMEFDALRSRLTTLIIQYNHIEHRLAHLEGRSPRWFPMPIPPGPATELSAQRDGASDTVWLSLRLPPRDSLQAAVREDILAITRHARK